MWFNIVVGALRHCERIYYYCSMKHTLILLCLFSAHSLLAQSDTTITYLDRNDKPCDEAKASKYAISHKEKDRWKKVVFDMADEKPMYGAYYSDAACTQFDGPYTAFNKNRKVTVTGRYVNNKKSGVWKGFSDDGKVIDSAFYKDGFIYGLALKWNSDGTILDSMFFEDNGNGTSRAYWPNGQPKQSGSYTAGKKSGLWVYNYRTGTKCQEVKYEADSAVSYTCYTEDGKVQTKDCYYEKEATFKGGEKAWTGYLSRKLSYARLPKAYYDGKIYGTVYIQFIVDYDGKIIEPKALNELNPELNEIAIEIIKNGPRWEPAIQYNRVVKAYRKQPITFGRVQ